jgi:hypothetical protein
VITLHGRNGGGQCDDGTPGRPVEQLTMPKPELEFHTPSEEWSSAGTPGIWDRRLSHDPDTGDTTAFQRYEPGAASAPVVITHDFWEEVILLDGDLHDITAARTFTAGMYACRPPGMPHGPYRSETGCLMFVTTRY